jgi:hypothetical protein
MRLQQSRSTAVISAPGIVQAITGSAPSNRASVETPILNATLTLLSLFLTILRDNSSKKDSNYPGFGHKPWTKTRKPSVDVLVSQSASRREPLSLVSSIRTSNADPLIWHRVARFISAVQPPARPDLFLYVLRPAILADEATAHSQPR